MRPARSRERKFALEVRSRERKFNAAGSLPGAGNLREELFNKMLINQGLENLTGEPILRARKIRLTGFWGFNRR